MAPFRSSLRPRRSGFGRSNRRSGSQDTDYQLYETEDEYVLSIELPGFETEDITVTWNDGLLNVAAERDDEKRGERTYHRRFRFPKDVDDDAIEAQYENGILEVRLPVQSSPTIDGKRIEVTG
jgi:HSP20 family protein